MADKRRKAPVKKSDPSRKRQASSADKNKIVKFRKPLNINVGMVVFAVIFLYLLISVFQYAFRPRTKMYEVHNGDIANRSSYTGLILREEKLVNSEYNGYINYYHRERQKAAVGNLIYTIDEHGTMSDYLNASLTDNSSLSSDNLKELKGILSSFSSSYSDSDFSEVYNVNATLNSMLMEYINVNALNELNEGSNNISFQKCYADIGGIIIYSMDGMEGMNESAVSEEFFSKDNYQKKNFSGAILVKKGDPVYKQITDDYWSVIIPIDENDQNKYKNDSVVTVTFTDKNIECNATFTYITGADNKTYGKISLKKYMIQFASDRYVNIEVKNSEAEGLIIPKSAITYKDAYVIPRRFIHNGAEGKEEGFSKLIYLNDGTKNAVFVSPTILRETMPVELDENQYLEDDIYVSVDDFNEGDQIVAPDSAEIFQIGPKKSLPGVYNMNRGFTTFKYVNILDENAEYVVVRRNMYYSIKCYDHIVLNAGLVNESDIVR